MLKRLGLKTMNYFLPLSDFLKLYSHFRLYFFFFFWTGLLFKAESPRVKLHNGINPVLGTSSLLRDGYLQLWSQGLENVILYAFCPYATPVQ